MVVWLEKPGNEAIYDHVLSKPDLPYYGYTETIYVTVH